MEKLLEQFTRECAEMERLNPQQALHMFDTCEDLRHMIERMRAEAARLDRLGGGGSSS